MIRRWILKTVATAAALLLYLMPANASLARCTLEVAGHTYLDSTCDVDRDPAGDSFSIGTGDVEHAKYFAYVNVFAKDLARGYWNGPSAESHADDELGILKHVGACWINDLAKVCASNIK